MFSVKSCQVFCGFGLQTIGFFFKSSSRTIEHTFLNGKEGLEVASQCLQTAYCLAPEDKHLEVSKPIEQIFKDATKNEPVRQRILILSQCMYSIFLIKCSDGTFI